MIPFIGLASGIGAGNPGCGESPSFLKEHLSLEADWKELILPSKKSTPIETIAFLNQKLGQAAFNLVKQNPFFISLGGDHSSAIGTWSGVASALRQQGDIGLLWIDAHMDSHTPQTSESGNIHGMPLAALLGHGDPLLTQIIDPFPKVKPENIVLIGIRSFEAGEAQLLERLNVRIYYMEEIERRGMETVLQEAIEIVTRNTVGYGVSFDLDSIDPSFVSAVGTPVPGGIDPSQFLSALFLFQEKPPLAFEFVEYNPFLDSNHKSLAFIRQLMQTIEATCPRELCSSAIVKMHR